MSRKFGRWKRDNSQIHSDKLNTTQTPFCTHRPTDCVPTPFHFCLSSLYDMASCKNYTIFMNNSIPRKTLELPVVQLKFGSTSTEIWNSMPVFIDKLCVVLSVRDGKVASYPPSLFCQNSHCWSLMFFWVLYTWFILLYRSDRKDARCPGSGWTVQWSLWKSMGNIVIIIGGEQGYEVLSWIVPTVMCGAGAFVFKQNEEFQYMRFSPGRLITKVIKVKSGEMCLCLSSRSEGTATVLFKFSTLLTAYFNHMWL